MIYYNLNGDPVTADALPPNCSHSQPMAAPAATGQEWQWDTPRYQLIGGLLYPRGRLVPVPAAPYELSKYIILERLIARGKGEAFLVILSSDPLTKARWDAATALDSDNPLLLAARDQLLPILGCAAEDAAQILRPGRDIP